MIIAIILIAIHNNSYENTWHAPCKENTAKSSEREQNAVAHAEDSEKQIR